MEDEIDFKALWKRQYAAQPGTGNLFDKLNKLKRSNYIKIIVTNILLIATSAFIASIWFVYKPQLLSTRLGIILVILAMFIYLLAYNRLYPVLKRIDNTLSNAEYLQSLLALRTKQSHLQGTMLSAYFIMISSGVWLYMIEPAQSMSTMGAVGAYAATVLWIGFNWFYIRPKTIKKQKARLGELIARFEEINRQLRTE